MSAIFGVLVALVAILLVWLLCFNPDSRLNRLTLNLSTTRSPVSPLLERGHPEGDPAR